MADGLQPVDTFAMVLAAQRSASGGRQAWFEKPINGGSSCFTGTNLGLFTGQVGGVRFGPQNASLGNCISKMGQAFLDSIKNTGIQHAPIQEAPLQQTPLQPTPFQETPVHQAQHGDIFGHGSFAALFGHSNFGRG